MASLARPPPPLRSYTETVQADVDDATSSLLLLALHPPSPPPLPPARPRSSTVGTTDSRGLRRRHSAQDMRLPPGLGDVAADVGESATEVNTDANALSGAAAGGAGRLSEGGGLRPPEPLRRVNSAELLVRVLDDDDDDADADQFSSDDESFRFRPPSVASTTTSRRSSRRGVRVEDWTDRPTSNFVRDVHITGYHAVGSEGGGFVVFDIEIETLPSGSTARPTRIRIHKRYSAFVRLRADLLRVNPSWRGHIPRLPPKSSFAKYRPSFLDKRRQHLAFWLSTVLLHPVVGGSPVVRQWVLE
ncbi:hypothetical protein JCM10449v2_005430 [Rhodotorula kratochvilovae]